MSFECKIERHDRTWGLSCGECGDESADIRCVTSVLPSSSSKLVTLVLALEHKGTSKKKPLLDKELVENSSEYTLQVHVHFLGLPSSDTRSSDR